MNGISIRKSNLLFFLTIFLQTDLSIDLLILQLIIDQIPSGMTLVFVMKNWEFLIILALAMLINLKNKGFLLVSFITWPVFSHA